MVCPTVVLLLLCGTALAESSEARAYRGAKDFAYPGPISTASPARDGSSNVAKSIELAKKISLVETEEEFFKLMNIVPPQVSYSVSLSERFGGIRERSNAIKATPAHCEPEMRSVPVKEDPEPGTMYFPNCIRVKRCGGCCNHESLVCQPNNTETRNYKLTVVRLEDNIPRQEIVAVEEHTQCQCECAVKAKDCNEKQYYVKDECRCVCKNTDEESKCWLQNDKKYWKSSECACKCRIVEDCATGFYFDQNFCSCKSLPLSRLWFNNENRRTNYNNYNRQPVSGRPKETQPVIVTLDAADPRRKHQEDPEYK